MSKLYTIGNVLTTERKLNEIPEDSLVFYHSLSILTPIPEIGTELVHAGAEPEILIDGDMPYTRFNGYSLYSGTRQLFKIAGHAKESVDSYFTMSFWCRQGAKSPKAADWWQPIVGFPNSVPEGGGESLSCGYALGAEMASNSYSVIVSLNGSGKYLLHMSGGEGKFHHYVIKAFVPKGWQYRNVECEIYDNGSLKQSGIININNSAWYGIFIGNTGSKAKYGRGSDDTKSDVSSVRIYNRFLSDTEIIALSHEFHPTR